jgi:hypothetical protein
MARYNFLVFSNCTDPSREEEFNRWYTHIHLPDLSFAKGHVSAKRYVNLEADAKAKYLAVYEFETEDIDESIQSLYDLAGAAWGKGRHVDFIEGAPSISLPTVSFQEIDPETLEPLEDVSYPTEPSEAVLASFARH